MLIGFTKLEETTIANFYGGEKNTVAKMFVDEMNRIMHTTLEPGASIGYHQHENGSEILYILSGQGKVIYDDKEENIAADLCHYCPKGHAHSLINNSDKDLVFFAVVLQQ